MAKNHIGERFMAEEMVEPHTGQPRGDWGVVDYATGHVRNEALTRDRAEELARQLNAKEAE